ncbi:hypothetical protein TNIN_25551, partial [Trichonephila inaurata madagascariensis]
MTDSKEEIAKDSLSKTSPLIIRLSTITSDVSFDNKDDISKISRTSAKPPQSVRNLSQACLYKSSELCKKENDLRKCELTFHKQPLTSLKLESEPLTRTAFADTLGGSDILNKAIQLPEETKFQCNDSISKHYNSSVFEKLSKDKFYSLVPSVSSKFNFSNFSDMLKGDQSLHQKKRKLSQDFKMKEEDQHIFPPVEPPLVMQSSNLLSDDKLDFGHDGGGIVTSLLEVEPLKKKPKYFKCKDNPSLCHTDHILNKNELNKTNNQIIDRHSKKNEYQKRDKNSLSHSKNMEKTLIKDETEFETLPANLPHPERDFKKCHEFNKIEPFKEEIFCVDAAYNSDVTQPS